MRNEEILALTEKTLKEKNQRSVFRNIISISISGGNVRSYRRSVQYNGRSQHGDHSATEEEQEVSTDEFGEEKL